ncbi:MAG TPA: hypothetical protein VJ255_04555, partial [Candidatus Acidoferrum sp.]|nr:hypothetical protein [Candidatus Acidoferrum sp.]
CTPAGRRPAGTSVGVSGGLPSVSRLVARVLSEETETMLKELETISGRGQVSQKQKGDDE